jgi:hypothetical protein
MPYHGILVHLLGDLLEITHVVDRQERIIHYIRGDDDVLVSTPGYQQIFRVSCGTCSFFGSWLWGTCKSRCIQYMKFVV